MKTLLITLVLLLSGCSKTVDSWQLIKGKELCEDRGSFVDKLKFSGFPNYTDVAYCTDGTIHIIRHTNIEK